MIMTHPGLAQWAIIFILASVIIFTGWFLWSPVAQQKKQRCSLKEWILGSFIKYPWLLFFSKLLFVGLFLLIIVAGLFGTPIAERNIATVLTWNLWWAGLIFSIFFLGSAWCAVCPWDAIAGWLVRRKLWKRGITSNSLDLQVPKLLRSVWPALLIFIGLTWMELGLGITLDPYATALVSLLMVLMATVSLSLFKRRAFCRYFCPVGRTVGFYSQLSAIELRPINPLICTDCSTLECYHGSDDIEPCPTGLVMGTLTQNSYCTSCGNCTQSCPESNIAWRLRSPSIEAISSARPHWDEAWFMLSLLALTAFHGLTMMPFWEGWMNKLAGLIGDSGQLLVSFSIGLTGTIFLIAALYSVLIVITQRITNRPFHELFSTFAFINLPLAFAYHMAHNLNHLIREGKGLVDVFSNPLGLDALPLSMMEKHERHMTMWFSQDILAGLQVILMIFGLWVAIQVIRYRSISLNLTSRFQLMPVLFYPIIITCFHLWMLAQPMTMRM